MTSMPSSRRPATAAAAAAAAALLAAALAAQLAAADHVMPVHFEHDRPRSYRSALSGTNVNLAEVETVRAFLKANPGSAVWMEGHASAPGAKWYNEMLSKRRSRYLLRHLGGLLSPAVGTGYSKGCKYAEPGVVVCGELHATTDAAGSRRVDVHVTKAPPPITCASHVCRAPKVRIPHTRHCLSAEDCEEKCCAMPSRCGEVRADSCRRPHTRKRLGVEDRACESSQDCFRKCCEPVTCQGFWDQGGCGEWTNGYKYDLECSGRDDCRAKCCVLENCRQFLKEEKCSFAPNVGSTYNRCDTPERCRLLCCMRRPNIRPVQPEIRPRPPPRDCEAWRPCDAYCVRNQCHQQFLSKGRAVCMEKCRGACVSRYVKACPGDGVTKHIVPGNCRDICTKRG